MRHENRELQLREHIAGIGRAARDIGPNLGGAHHIERQHRLKFVGARLPGETAAKECARGRDVGRQILRLRSSDFFHLWTEKLASTPGHGRHEVDAGD
jgi:hypothetical protein